MIAENQHSYPTYEILTDLKSFTRHTHTERSLNKELQTFQPEIQIRILQAMRVLLADEMAYVISIDNMKRYRAPY
ncbi:hypothetical protein [Virgibacillus sediminis]|uniref:Uncharacterized protein n=1 Tax=Virgibacillus sediminis TaxID=202260 RepID=A0ABV7AA84_9BACI